MTEHKLVECSTHGKSRYSMMCGHLLESRGMSYFMMRQTEEEPAMLGALHARQYLTKSVAGQIGLANKLIGSLFVLSALHDK